MHVFSAKAWSLLFAPCCCCCWFIILLQSCWIIGGHSLNVLLVISEFPISFFFLENFPDFEPKKWGNERGFPTNFFLFSFSLLRVVCASTWYFSLSLSLSTRGGSHTETRRKTSTRLKKREMVSPWYVPPRLWWSFLQQRVLRKGRSEKNSILFSTTIFNEESSLTPRASSALHSRRTPIRSRESRDSPLFCCVFSGTTRKENWEDKIWEDLGFSSFGWSF